MELIDEELTQIEKRFMNLEEAINGKNNKSKLSKYLMASIIVTSIILLLIVGSFYIEANSGFSFNSFSLNKISSETSENLLLQQTGLGILSISSQGKAWNTIKSTGTESNLIFWTSNAKDKKAEIGWIPKNNICGGLTDKNLRDENGSVIKDDKDKEIVLKCESSKCDGKNCYHISLTEAQAMNIEGYVKLGENSVVSVYQDINLLNYDLDFANINITLFKNISGNYTNTVNDIWVYEGENLKFGANDSQNEDLESYKYTIESNLKIFEDGIKPYIKNPNNNEIHIVDFSDICNRHFEPYEAYYPEGGFNETYYNKSADCQFNYYNDSSNYYLEITFNSDEFIDPTITISSTEVASSSSTTNIPISDQAPWDSLVMYYAFDINATLEHDYTKYGNDGVFSGATPPTRTTGVYVGGVDYPGIEVDSHIGFTETASTTFTEDFTLSIWVNFDVDGQWHGMMTNGHAVSGNSDWYMARRNDDNSVFFTGRNSTGNKFNPRTETLNINQWYHIVAVYNVTDAMIYVDGVLNVTGVSAGGDIDDSWNNIDIGSGLSIRDPDAQFDEAMIFNTSLNSSQILDLYNNQSSRFFTEGTQKVRAVNITNSSTWNNNGFNRVNLSTGFENLFDSNVSARIGQFNFSVNVSGLVLYMPFEWGSAVDISGNGNDGTLNGDILFNETGGLNETGGFKFDGDDDYIDTSDSVTQDFSAGFTLCSWANPEVIDIDGRIIYRFDASSADGYFLTQDDSGLGAWRITVFVNPSSDTVLSDSAPSGDWQHICGVRNDSGTLFLYVDGSQQSSTGTIAGAIDSNDGLRIGIDINNAKEFNGTIDEVMIFNRSLSEAEISDLYLNQSEKFNVAYFTPYQNLTSNQNLTFNISTEADFIFPDYKLIAGNSTNPFYSPILNGDTILGIFNFTEAPAGDNPPVSTLNSPPDNNVSEQGIVSFNCSATDDINLQNVTLNVWNFTTFELVHTNFTTWTGTTNSTTFDFNFDFDGNFSWNCLVFDNATQSDFANSNFTLNITTIVADNEFPQFSGFTEDPSEPTTYLFGQIYEFNTTVLSTNGTVGIEFNNTNSSATNFTNNFTVTFPSLSAGNYSYYWWGFGNGTNENFNFTQTFSYNVSQAIPEGTLTNNTQLTLEYPNVFNFSFSESNEGDGDLTYIVYRGGTDVTSEADANIVLGVGTHEYVFNTTGGQNYTINSSMDAFTVTINQNNTYVIALALTPSDTETYPTETTATGSGCPTEISCALNLNTTGVVSNPHTITLGIGVFNYTFNTTGNTNYSAKAVSDILTININTSVCDVGFNETSSLTFPQSFTVFTNCTSANIITRDVTIVANGSTQSLGVGVYNFTVTRTDNLNYSNILDQANFEITQATSEVNLTLNNIQNNITILQGQIIDLNCSTITGDSGASLTMFREGVLINNGTSPIGNITQFNTIQEENITCFYEDSQNFTTSFDTWFVNVVPRNVSLDHFSVQLTEVVINSPTYIVIINNSFNLTSTQHLTAKGSGALRRVFGGGNSNVDMRLTIDSIVLFDTKIRTVGNVNDRGVFNLPINDTLLASGEHTLLLELREDGSGSINLSNFELHLDGDTANDGFEVNHTTDVSDLTYSSTTFINIANFTIGKDFNGSTLIDVSHKFSADDTDTTPSCYLQNNITGERTPIYSRWLDQAGDTGSTGMSYRSKINTQGLEQWELFCLSSDLDTITTNVTFYGIGMINTVGNTIQGFQNETGSLSISGLGNKILSFDNYIPKNATNIMMEGSIIIQSTSGSQQGTSSPILKINSSQVGEENCSLIYERSLSSNSDIGTIKFYAGCVGVSIGTPTDFNIYVDVQGANTLDILNVSLTGYERGVIDTATGIVPPIVEIFNPVNPANVTGTIDINATISDISEKGWSSNISLLNSSGIFNLTITDDSGVFNNLTGTTFNTTTVSDGDYFIQWNVTNSVGTNSDTHNITIDNTGPTITIDSPTNNTFATAIQDLNVSANEFVDTWWYTNDSGVTNNTFTPNITRTWEEGSNLIFVYANDSVGNIGVANVTFTIDTGVPVVSIVFPQNISYNTNVSELNYTVTSGGGGPQACWNSINDGATNSTSQSPGVNFTGLTSTEGSNTWTVYCNNTIGGEGSDVVTFFKDTIPPSFTNLENQTIDNQTALSYDINAEDSGSGLDSFFIDDIINFTIDSGTGVLQNNTQLIINLYILNISINDSVGNINSSLLSINVTAPSAEVERDIQHWVNRFTKSIMARLDHLGNFFIEGEANIGGVKTDGNGKVVCIKSDGNLGTCTDTPDGGGTCSCN